MNKKFEYLEALTDRELHILRLKIERKTNQEIADSLYLARNTVRWYVSQIYSKLHVTNRTELKLRVEEFDLLDEQRAPTLVIKHTLPNPITSFIGRKQEITEIIEVLSRARLLTLTGAGGTGKTRLAIEVAEIVRLNYRDGVYFVNLAPLNDPSRVANAIADVLGVVENRDESIADTLKRVLQHRQCLLMLDNFEHLLSAAPLVSNLLQSSDALNILVTSREVLHLYGEQEYRVSSLKLPDLNLPHSLELLAQNEAIQLFDRRARAASRRFRLNEDNILTIAKICTRVDGLPLAIELAATRSKLLTPDALLERLGNRLDTLTSGARDLPERQQTIRETISWSYDLLDKDEKTLFARLAVFRGGRSLEACEAVCAGALNIAVFDGLASLIDKNLLVCLEDSLGEPRFWMLETIHEYALELLEASDEFQTMQSQHAQYFTQLAERAEPELSRTNQQKWSMLLEIEYDNLRAALRWMLSGGNIDLGVRTVNALDYFWRMHVYQFEGDRWTQHALEYIEDIAPKLQVKLLIEAGTFTWWLRLDFLSARQIIEQALSIAHKLGDKQLTALALTNLGKVFIARPKELEEILPLDKALDCCFKSLAILRELGQLPQLAYTLNILGDLQSMGKDFTNARANYEECIAISHQIGDIRRVQVNLYNLAGIAREQGDHKRATSLARESLRLAQKINNKFMMASTLSRIGDPIIEVKRAVRLLAASEANLQRMGTIRQPGSLEYFQKRIATAQDQLDEEIFSVVWEEGSAMSLEEAVAYALDELDKPESVK